MPRQQRSAGVDGGHGEDPARDGCRRREVEGRFECSWPAIACDDLVGCSSEEPRDTSPPFALHPLPRRRLVAAHTRRTNLRLIPQSDSRKTTPIYAEGGNQALCSVHKPLERRRRSDEDRKEASFIRVR